MCILKKFPGDADTIELGTTLWKLLQQTKHKELAILHWSAYCFLANLDFLTPLLRDNSHTIQFSHLKYTIQWFLLYSQICVTITAFFIGQ